jgi:hypothetical protein
MSPENDVRITIEESGGFAGIKLPGISLSAADLSDADNTAFLKLLQQADLSNLPPIPKPPSLRRDSMQIKITTESEGQQNVVRVNEGDAPENVQQLIDWIKNYRKNSAS